MNAVVESIIIIWILILSNHIAKKVQALDDRIELLEIRSGQ